MKKIKQLKHLKNKKAEGDVIRINNYEWLKYYEASSIKSPIKPIDPKDWPEDWKRISFKVYPRFQKINIPKIKEDNLLKLINKRRSQRNFHKYKISLKEIAYILQGAAINKVINKDLYYDSYRAYPSAGARYPLEIYLFIIYSKDLKNGIYHFNVRDGCLEYLWKFSLDEIKNIFSGQEFVLNSSMIFLITANMRRGISKYRERYLRFVFLEAGHLAQNLILLATNIGLKTCPIGGFIEERAMNILDIRKFEFELPIYALTIGK
jgi:SagB-type dehydrogenase family enzyme